MWLFKINYWDFPGGQTVKNLPCNVGAMGSISGRGTKIPRAMEQLSSTNREHLQHCRKFDGTACKFEHVCLARHMFCNLISTNFSAQRQKKSKN